jgi:hypothetical protein
MNLNNYGVEDALPGQWGPYPRRHNAGVGVLADSLIAVFDSDTNLTWTTEGLKKVIASFKLGDVHIKTTFDRISDDEWQVGF